MYASIVSTGPELKETIKKHEDTNQILQSILNKITNFEDSLTKFSERVSKLESSIKKSAPKPKKK